MQEARNTGRHASGGGSSRLRDNAITFVSAGNMSREEPKGQIPLESSSSEEENEEDCVNDAEEEPVKSQITQEHNASPPTNEFLQATESMHITEPPREQENTTNGADTSSDEDELVFSGRRNAPGPISQSSRPVHVFKATATEFAPSPAPTPSAVQPAQQAPSEPKSRVPQDHSINSPSPAIAIQQLQPPPESLQLSMSSDAAPTSNRRHPVSSRYRKGWRSRKQVQADEEDAILQDYIANMAKDDEDEDEEAGGSKPHRRNETFRFYDGATETNVKVQTTANGKHTTKPPRQAIDWSSDDLEAFDDLSTTDDDVEEIEQVLRFRERPSGPQYLVTALGRATSDAKWMLHGKLTSATALNEIQVYEEIRNMRIDVESEDSDSVSSSGDEALDDLMEDIESEAEENTRIFEHTQRMTDEEIARVLAKQEELGMGGDELVLFDGQQVNGDSEDDVFGNGEGFIPFSMAQHTSNRGRSKRNRRQGDSFPSAEAFADALDQDPYGAFDVMDFDRPSLRPKRKGRKSYPFDLELEDEELEQQLVSTWMKDREKKTARKREKMEERASELFEAGLRNDPAVIKAEMRRFLVEETDTLRLAPMEPHLRASVHRLAKSLKLNSRSEGKEGVGAGRFPVLTKTPHTPYYTVDTIWEIDALFNMRKFFPKHGGGSYKGPKATKVPGLKKGKDRGGFSAASYANGEIVGAAAPELGVDNKGRALLEKMGWVSGMGIGKEGNEGVLEHIKHVVKTGKAGLG